MRAEPSVLPPGIPSAPATGSGSGAGPGAAADGPDGAVLEWVAKVTQGRVLSAERFTRGRQAWWVDVDAGAGTRRWLVKGRRVPASVLARSRLLQDFGAGREAAAMGALQGSGIPVAEFGGYDPGTSSLLLGRVAGSALLQRVASPTRQAIVDDYAHHLAHLHALDWRDLVFEPPVPVPASAEEMAVGGWLASAEADASTTWPRRRHDEPLLELAGWWLHRFVPAGRGPADMRFLHGDAGVNNFMFDHGRVTALIDWELAILGDPMSDLGNARFREALYPTGTYPGLVATYDHAGGARVDRPAVTYYTVLSAMMLSLGMLANVHRPRATQPEAVARLWQDALARVVTAEALGEALGIELPPPTQPDPRWSTLDTLPALLVERLDRQAAEAAPGQPAAEALGYAQLARAVRDLVGSSSWLESALLDDSAEVLGGRATDERSALSGLSELVRADPARSLRAVLPVLAADSRRRLEVMRPLQEAEVWEDAEPVTRTSDSERLLPVLPAY